MKYASVTIILLQNFLLCILNRLLLSEHIYSELVFAVLQYLLESDLFCRTISF